MKRAAAKEGANRWEFFGARRVLGAISAMVMAAGLAAAQNPAALAGNNRADIPQASGGVSVPADYRVGPGDILEISVWKEPDASSPSVLVRPDGKISMPLINDLYVSGKTPMEIQSIVMEKLAPYVNSPNVTVIIRSILSKKVYVLGEVARTGVFDIAQPKTVLQVLTEAGGLQQFAKQSSIYVLRNEGGKQKKLPFNYKEVVSGQKMEQNVELQPGDTIVVP